MPIGSNNILKDTYGNHKDNVSEFCLVESVDKEDLTVKLTPSKEYGKLNVLFLSVACKEEERNV